MSREEILENLNYIKQFNDEIEELTEKKEEQEQWFKSLEFRLRDLNGRVEGVTNRLAPIIFSELSTYLFGEEGIAERYFIKSADVYIVFSNSGYMLARDNENNFTLGGFGREKAIFEAHISEVNNEVELREFYSRFGTAMTVAMQAD